jgi:hypothetical protein
MLGEVNERSKGGPSCGVRLTGDGSLEELEAAAALGVGGGRPLDGLGRELENSWSGVVMVYSTFLTCSSPGAERDTLLSVGNVGREDVLRGVLMMMDLKLCSF